MSKASTFVMASLTGLLLLASCNSSQPSAQLATPDADTINVTIVGGQTQVTGGDAEAVMDWKSHHPEGQVLKVPVAGGTTEELVIQDGHAFISGSLVGDVSGGQVIGIDGVIANLDGTPVLRSQAFGITKTGNKWPGAVVPYVYDNSATATIRSQFEEARGIYASQTGIRFVPRSNQSTFVRVVSGSGCSSFVGMMTQSFKPNGQEVTLGSNGCGVSSTLHEMGHAVGMEHEQNRCDRDQSLTVHFDLIAANWQSQYQKNCSASRVSYGTYDYGSIMHYGNAKTNGQWQMTDPNGRVAPENIGKRNGLSALDKASFAAIYGYGGNTGGTTPPPPTTPPVTGGGQGTTLPLGQWKSLRVKTAGFTNRYIRHAYSEGFTEVVSASSNTTLKQDATFRIVGALDGTPCYSFESRNFPGKFLRHANFRARIDAKDGSDVMNKDATFCAQIGLAGTGGVSLVSRNNPGYYLRHRQGQVWLDKNDNSAQFKNDASWDLADAWAP
ncbi:AbfB domain-containing protein [Deinococcus sp.]|uniref:AbfB domain-containing protein n=1 Tax=Deinococcus sp. TaxID=47478 RepID=UPI003B5AAB84